MSAKHVLRRDIRAAKEAVLQAARGRATSGALEGYHVRCTRQLGYELANAIEELLRLERAAEIGTEEAAAKATAPW